MIGESNAAKLDNTRVSLLKYRDRLFEMEEKLVAAHELIDIAMTEAAVIAEGLDEEAWLLVELVDEFNKWD